MTEFKKIIEDVIKQLNEIHYESGDLSDVGNEIGIAIGKYIVDNKMGYEKTDFIHGITHGISLVDGTH